MKIEPIKYCHWSNAYRCTAGAAELVAVADIGPRILSLRWQGGPNLLHEDATGFGVGDWRLYGGHRFTVAPEGAESYAPDNFPCVVNVRPDQLHLSAERGAHGTQRALTVSAARDGVGFDLRHDLENHGPHSWRGALWAITCVPPSGVIAPRADSAVRFWPGTKKSDWRFAPDRIALVSQKSRGKIGWHGEAAWLASLQPQAILVIHSPNPPPVSHCVDGGCNIEIFACPDYVELETLGGEITLDPGSRASHLQRWRLLAPEFASGDCASIAALAGCASNPPIVYAA